MKILAWQYSGSGALVMYPKAYVLSMTTEINTMMPRKVPIVDPSGNSINSTALRKNRV